MFGVCVCVCVCVWVGVCVCVCVCVYQYYLVKRKDIVGSKFLISLNYSFNHLCNHLIYKGSCFEHITSCVNIHLYECVSPLNVLCVFVCLWYQVRVAVKNYIICQTSVSLMACCIKHTWRSFWYHGTKAWNV